jgi:hypothetical protein
MSRIDSWYRKISTGRHFQNGHHNAAQIPHCLISTSWIDIIYPHIKFWWYRTMLNFCGIVVAILKMATGRNFSMLGINSRHHYLPTIPHKFNIVRFQRHFICGYIMMSRIDSWHWTISTGRHFQNGHHIIAKNQHCPISSQFDMWVDNDVPNHHYLPTY